MNILDIIILSILGISLISGMYKGFLASGLTILGFVAAWMGAMHFTPQLSQAVQQNQTVMSMLNYYLAPSEFFASGELAGRLVESVSQSELVQAVEGMKLPGLLVESFMRNVAEQAFSALKLQTLSEYLGQTICGAAINVLSFLVMFAVSYVVALFAVNLLNHVFRFPVLRHLDWLLGGAFGLVRGAVVALLLFSVAPLVLSMIELPVVQEMVDGSRLYGLFAKSNVIERLIRSAF